MGNSRYVENGDYVRLQYCQLSYNLPNKIAKNLGMQTLRLSASANNLFCWTRYSGVDPEISVSGWGLATDKSQTPRAKSFTANINIGF